MQRFRFRLETVLQLRRRAEDEAKLELARAHELVRQARSELSALGEELGKMQREQKEKRVAAVDILEMRHTVAYRHKLKTDMLAKGRQIESLQNDVEKIRKKLIKATQKVRALELLRERRLVEWKDESAAREQGFIDDVSQQAFIRRKKDTARRVPA